LPDQNYRNSDPAMEQGFQKSYYRQCRESSGNLSGRTEKILTRKQNKCYICIVDTEKVVSGFFRKARRLQGRCADAVSKLRLAFRRARLMALTGLAGPFLMYFWSKNTGI
jgi:hypothetical protein